MQSYDLIFIVLSPLCALAVFYLSRVFFLERVSGWKIELVSYTFFCVAMCVTFLWTRIPVVFLVFNIVGFFLISFNYRASILRRIMGSLLIYGTLLVIEMIVWRTVGFFEWNLFLSSSFDSIIGLFLNRIIAVIVSYLLYRYTRKNEKIYAIPYYYYVAHIVVLLGTIYLFLSSLSRSFLTLGQVLLSGMILVMVNGMIVFLDTIIYQSIADSHEKRTLQVQNYAYEHQIELMKQSASTISGIKHDIKNHVLALKVIHEQRSDDDFQSYISETLCDMENKGNFVHSGHIIIDSIVNFKLQLLEGDTVDMRLSVQVPSQLPISSHDLTILLGNLLDNAVTAVSKMTHDKMLSLHIDCDKGNFIILLDNSYIGTLVKHRDHLKSTKEQPHLHGIGLRRVEEIVDKYHGILDIDYENNLFAVAVVIPLAN